jgi:hypothetical protein
MACLPSLAFVAFAASFEPPPPPPRSDRLPPSPLELPATRSHAPLLLTSRWNFAARDLVLPFGFSGSFALLPPSPACCFGAIWWCPPSVSSEFCRFGVVYVVVCAWGKSLYDFLCSCTSELTEYDGVWWLVQKVLLSNSGQGFLSPRMCTLCSPPLVLSKFADFPWVVWKYVLEGGRVSSTFV